MKLVRLYVCTAIAVILGSNIAKADPDASQAALANQLFDDAEKLVAGDRVSEACPKYAESQRLDPQLGTLLHLGVCYGKVGKTASAWASFKDAADMAARKHDERESVARQYIADLEPRLSRLTIEVAWGAPATIELKRDGEPLGRAAWGSPVPVDPGPHVITASSSGFKDWQTTIDVPAGASSVRVSVPKLEPLVASPIPPPAVNTGAAPFAPQPAPAPMADRSSSDSSSTQRTWGYVIGGVGVVGLVVGTVSAFALNSKESDRTKANACSAIRSCTGADVDRIHTLTSDARMYAGVANIGFIAGGAAVLGGAILILTALPKETKTADRVLMQPWVGTHSAGLAMGGAW